MPLHGFPHGKHIPKIQQLWPICGRLTQETTLYFHPFAQMALLEEFQTLTSNMRFNLSLAWLNYPNSFTSTTSSSSIPKHDFGIVDGPWPKKKKKKVQTWSSPTVGSKEKTRCWGTIFSLVPHIPILFNHIYLFTKKYQNLTHKLFWASINISHSIGPQIFHISLSTLGHDINYIWL